MSKPTPSWLERVAATAVVVLGAGLGISLVDACFARSADATLSLPRLWGVDWSLFATFAAPIWLFLCVASAFFASTEPASITARWRRLTSPSADARERAAGLLLGAPVLVLWLGVVARGAFKSFSAPIAAPAAAAAISIVTLGSAWVSLLLVAATARWIARAYKRPLLSPAVALLVSSVFLVGCLALLVVSGETSGAGGTWKMFGVLRRVELDLRPATLAAVWLLLGYWCPGYWRPRSLFVTLAALCVLIGLAGVGYRGWSEEMAFDIRRGAPLGRLMLPLAWRLTDRDHDGMSGAFGGGDCDDGNAAIHPGAVDVPGNGIDEDCSGFDDQPVHRIVPPAPEPHLEKRAEARLGELPPKLNVVLVTIDTLRADLGYMGYPRPITPNIDRLAAKSVVFEHAYSLASYTGKSIGPLLIGHYPSETHRNFGHFTRFSTQDTFIQERLEHAGVHTVSVQGHWYFKEDGVGRGFDELDMSAAPRVAQAEGDRTVNSDKLSDAAIAHLGALEGQTQPFFLWVHYLDPHAEYVRHPEFDFGSDQRALYDGEIAFTDFHVGRLLDFIAHSPLAANTALILTSDHGEAFREHGMIRHGFELWEELVRVPLLIYVPGVAARREPIPRSAIDLAPTIFSLFRLAPPTGEARPFSGYSLLPDLLLPSGYHPEPRPILVDMCEGPFNDERQAFIEDGKKLITSLGRPLGLYDLEHDPGEKNNLLSNAALRNEIQGQMKAFKQTLDVVSVPRR